MPHLPSEHAASLPPHLTRAAEYVRMSTEHQQYSTENQEDAIRQYAARRGIEIVRTYADEGKSGLRLDGRDALKQLLADVQSGNAEFSLILVYDVSRWGRFQDADEAAHNEFICRRAGIDVQYCAEPFENDGSFGSDIQKMLKRKMAGEYSRELSVKVFAGQCRLIEHGCPQRRWRHSVVCGRHYVVPQPSWVAATGNHAHGRVVVVAEPHATHQVAREADEPSVAVVLAGAGFASGRAVQGGGLACPCADNLGHYILHLGVCGGADHLPGIVRLVAVEHGTGTIADLGDAMHLGSEAARRDGGYRWAQHRAPWLPGRQMS